MLRLGVTKQSFVIFPEFFSTYLTSHKTLAEKNKNLEITVEHLENSLADKDAIIREYGLENMLLVTATTSNRKPLVLYPITQDVIKMYSTILLSKGFNAF